MKEKVKNVDDGRKKIWICVLTAVSAAVIIGILYWMSMPSPQNSEGFLIRNMVRQPQICIQEEAEKEAGCDVF